MTDPRAATQELQAQFLDSIRKSQDAVVDSEAQAPAAKKPAAAK